MSPTRIVSTFHQPSAVVSSCKCRLSSTAEHLVVAKLNAIEVHSTESRGLKHVCTLQIWGKVLSVKAVPITDSARSNIVVLLDQPEPELLFLSFSEREQNLKLDKQLSLSERSPSVRPAEFFSDILVDPSGQLAVVSCYQGKLKVLTLENGSYVKDVDVSIPENNVLSFTLLPLPDEEFALAILHLDNHRRLQLLARDLTDWSSIPDLSQDPSVVLHQTIISSEAFPYPEDDIPQLIPVSTPEGTDINDGILVVGGRKIIFYALNNVQAQKKVEQKRRKSAAMKQSGNEDQIQEAIAKDKERNDRIRQAKGTVLWPFGAVTAVSSIGDDALKFLIGDSFGRLCLLSLATFDEHGLVLIPLGETSSPRTLTYITNQIVYLGSFKGDSQLLKIHNSPVSSSSINIACNIPTISTSTLVTSSKGKQKATGDELPKEKGKVIKSEGSYLELLSSFKNIAPIVDAVLVDLYDSGHCQVVTCSGGQNTGSVNIVRTGLDFQELASIVGLTNVVKIWSVRDEYKETLHTGIVVSTLEETHFLRFDSFSTLVLENSALNGFVTDTPTLCVYNITAREVGTSSYNSSSMIVQVAPRGVFLLDKFLQIDHWKPIGGVEIVAASVNASQVLLALAGGQLLTLKVDNKKLVQVVQSKLYFAQNAIPPQPKHGPDTYPPWLPTEISCVSCIPMNESKYFSIQVAAAFWHTNQIKIYNIASSGFTFQYETPQLPATVRSILFYNFGTTEKNGDDYRPYLLAGLANGTVVSFVWSGNQFTEMKLVALGSGPVELSPNRIGDGTRGVLAVADKTMVISCPRGRLQYSHIILRDVSAATLLNSDDYPSTLILANANGLAIGRVKDLDKLHIQSIPLGLDNPIKIAHVPALRCFGVVCTRTEPFRIGDAESTRSLFKLLDETTFKVLCEFSAEVNETVVSMTTRSVDVNDELRTFFCLGAYIYEPGERGPTRGRLIVLAADKSGPEATLSFVTSVEISGCPYSLATTTGGLIAAAVNSSVSLYRLAQNESEPSTFSLSKLSVWNHNYIVANVVARGEDCLVACDCIQSVSLLQITPGPRSRLDMIARDYEPLWPLAVETCEGKGIIGASDALNLFSFSLDMVHARPVLKRDGFYHVGDLVSKFLRGSIAPKDDNTLALEPTHVFCTSSGRIGVIVDVGDEGLGTKLKNLQVDMGQVISGVGGVSHARYRAPKNTRPRPVDEASYGFVDGDFLELLLISDPKTDEKIFDQGLELEEEELRKVLEALQNMH
ncbi:uncharacterized protein BT62DRAFT_969553 [Guyanagaster necrorhizus]|uniref:DNA damage-binding protein 1 n=1 Tax=Guyanagaster necrorhizus TaxID=856835 RepID=A0A9P8AS05_9AGAR|nr:uncharacterized protein BT62DRAFT_969553 [Guyanagaster necrorhizus MCA 3950]KAG7445774.1 hypothetical protein BT62DRAFT_969553 [Guyanagaster necrorhizus MCA 3950]